MNFHRENAAIHGRRHRVTETKSFFTDGEAYQRMMGRWSRSAGDVFLDWLALPSGLRWLDVGCGTGAFTQLLVDKCQPRQIGALDPSVDQIAYARTTPAAKTVNFQVGDAQALPFADGEFDAASMALVITFVPEPAKALAEMKRVVKPGGMIGTYVWDFLGGGSPQQPLREAVEAMGVTVSPAPGHANSRIERLSELFTAASLDQVATRMIEIDVTFPDFNTYWESQTALANTVVQYLREMTPADVEKVKARLREGFAAGGNGRIAYKARASAAKGRVPA
jgi:ubiquinone/menaquinone biosynthesis C-methylase UbiE